MLARNSRTPHAHNDHVKSLRRTCGECGKSTFLREADGMIRSHKYPFTTEKCKGSGKLPVKAVHIKFKKD